MADAQTTFETADLSEVTAARNLFAAYLRWRVAEITSPHTWKPGPISFDLFAQSILTYLKGSLIFHENVLNGEELVKLWRAGFSGVQIKVDMEGEVYVIDAEVWFKKPGNWESREDSSYSFRFTYNAELDRLSTHITQIGPIKINDFPTVQRDQIPPPGNFAPVRKRGGPLRLSVDRNGRPVTDFSRLRSAETVTVRTEVLERWAKMLRDPAAAMDVRTDILTLLVEELRRGQ
jgi:hypothetical protein